MMTAVVDTNVVASGVVGILEPASPPGAMLRAWQRSRFALIMSEPMMAEFDRTLTKPYFRRKLHEPGVADAIEAVHRDATLVAISVPVHDVASHREDDVVLATAISAGADYLVTGDRQLQLLGTIDGIAIVSPREFLDVLASGPPED